MLQIILVAVPPLTPCYPFVLVTVLGEPAFLLVVQITIYFWLWFANSCPPLASSPTLSHPTDQVKYLHRRHQQYQPSSSDSLHLMMWSSFLLTRGCSFLQTGSLYLLRQLSQAMQLTPCLLFHLASRGLLAVRLAHGLVVQYPPRLVGDIFQHSDDPVKGGDSQLE